jgi:arsenite methyltransferase
MKEYLLHTANPDDFDLVSVIDELPLWSAPFGLNLLEIIELKKNCTVLDLGCGPGFPLIEIAQRLGNTSRVYGIDPWWRGLERVRLKQKVYALKNIRVIRGVGEYLPFPTGCFDLIVSNNGMNNVRDMKQSLTECARVCKPDAQLTFTLNLEDTMLEFYTIFKQVLELIQLSEVMSRLQQHIYDLRKPLAEIEVWVRDAGFAIKNIIHDSFRLRYSDGTALFEHYFIKFWFLNKWKQLLDEKDWVPVFERIETELNRQAEKNGEIVLTIPFVTVDCRRKN